MEQLGIDEDLTLTVPTVDEIVRIKAFLIVKRNQVRDYLDVAALGSQVGTAHAGMVLRAIDDYYQDLAPQDGTVAMQVATQLADPRPKDSRTTSRLSGYKGLAARWRNWSQVTAVCRRIADEMLIG